MNNSNSNPASKAVDWTAEVRSSLASKAERHKLSFQKTIFKQKQLQSFFTDL